jgi:ubiquitin-like domain-containing CTD phosphatase 1
MSGGDANTVEAAATSLPTVTLVAKYGKEKIELASLPPSTSILEVKELLRQKTGILPMRQKMIGLKVSSGASSVADETRLGELKVRKGGDSNASVVHQIILMGTPEEAIFVDPSDKGEIQLCVDTLLLLCFSDLQLLFIDKCR